MAAGALAVLRRAYRAAVGRRRVESPEPQAQLADQRGDRSAARLSHPAPRRVADRGAHAGVAGWVPDAAGSLRRPEAGCLLRVRERNLWLPRDQGDEAG